MRVFQFSTEVRVPGAVESVFTFFADASNLELLTPPWLKFEIITPRPIEMGVGTLIDYRIRLRVLPMQWRSRITAWQPPLRFVDEQVSGPYRLWIHEHTFEQDGADVVVRDHVRYAIPGGPGLETLLHSLFVKRDLNRIFAFRVDAMRRLLPTGLKRTAAGIGL